MLLDVKVKTLDSQNYEFQAEDDWTVSRFKEHIQETVNVPAPEQRLIFCGRVLQNDKKLAEYDVGGKVVHLVRRPPPASDQPDNDPLAAGANSADSNNNDGNYSIRFGEDNNVLFSAMTLGPDGNMNQILRHIMTLQQAIYARTFGGPSSAGETSNPERDLDRRLTNAARLLRITVNLIAECNTRLPASSPIAIRGTAASSNASAGSSQAEPVNLATPQSVLSAALSHSDLQADPNMQASGETNTPSVERMTVDDSDLGSPSTSASSSARRPSRQSLTTDDLPQGNSRPTRPFAPIDELRTRDENRNGPMTSAQRDEFYLDRYLTILNCSSDVQSQIRVLIRRYRELISMSRGGGLIVTGESGADSQQASEGQSSRPLTAQELADGNSESAGTNEQQQNIPESLRREARLLSYYVPRILHHHSHLQHALSDFTVDSSQGRLQVPQLSAPRRTADRPRYVARRSVGPRPPQLARSDTLGRPEVVGIPTTLTSQTQAGATIVISENGIHTPVTIPQVVSDADVTWGDPHEREIIRIEIASQPIGQPPAARSREHSQSRGQSGSRQQAQNLEPGQQGQRAAQETTSNSTQTASRPFGIISGRIPLPFDYYLTCFSPLAHHIVAARSTPRSDAAPRRVQVRPSRPQESAPSGLHGQPGRTAPGAMPTGQPLDSGLTEVVSNIIGSIFRPPPGQPGQPEAARNPAGAPSNPSQDPLMNMIPELVINAASQILGGVFGIQNEASNPQGSQQTNPQQQQQQPVAETQGAHATVVMDIDIDDHYSSQSESAYQDAQESQPCTAASAARTQASAALRPGQSTRTHDQASVGEPSGLSAAYSREQLSQVFRDHPDWRPIIESDIRLMELQGAYAGPAPYFSDAYLASIPRKRRRLLVSNPDRVLILQPSPSQAISNLLQRAIASSNLSSNEQAQALSGIANDQEVQRAYEDYLKSAVEERLKTDEDYNESKYTNSSRYFK